VTAFTRAPAEGEWAEGAAVAHHDITVEVIVDGIDRGWWEISAKRSNANSPRKKS
jgi:hypothetical protein